MENSLLSPPPDKYYLNIGRASDLKNPRERLVYRILEILPGALIWGTLVAMVFFSWFKPVWTAFFIIIFCIYWLSRTVYFVFHLVAAHKKMKENMKIGWLEELNKLSKKDPAKNWQEIYHLVIFPMYKEGLGVVRSSFLALINSQYPKEKMIVVLAQEERAGEEALTVAKFISREFGDKFYRFLVTRHKERIEGEIAGKGSNESWAGREVKEKIIDEAKIPYENIVVSCFDIDTQVFPQYFTCLTYHYLTSASPTRASYQPIPLYLNNLWEAPFFSRVVSSCNVFWQMIQQQRPEQIVTYSSHSMSFKALVEMDFWQTNVVSEDAGIFWKSFLFYDGDYRIVPFHYPLSMDSCAAKTFWQTIVNQYRQQRRWAWGSEGIPYLLFGLLKNKKIPLKKKLRYPFLLIEGFWAWGTNAFLVLFLGWLPLIFGGEQFRYTVLAYNLPQIVSYLMDLALTGLIVCIIISTLLLTPRPRGYSRWRSLSMIVQWIFFPFTFIFFGSIPAIDAQTRLMLGKYMGFWITEKNRKPVLKAASIDSQ
ncbi:MAG: glycosyltransferase family 2 protein [Candidatus Wildermuthbacteria bacterium]|nr:glycosyltransferase family 2 protein [Candidatus Wildermuthbacteria bacterium]